MSRAEQQRTPSAILDSAAHAGPPPVMVRARVRPGAHYTVGDPKTGERTRHEAGAVVELPESEYRMARHCLVTDEDAAAAERAAFDARAAGPSEDSTGLFRAFRHRARAAAAQKKTADDERRLHELRPVIDASVSEALRAAIPEIAKAVAEVIRPKSKD